jgi:HAE1 family hydrophobic/amphiphilic exporter-1
MNLSEPFIRRPVMTTLVMIAIVMAGLLCYFSLPVSNLPDVNYPSINVTVAYPGLNPETMANTIATPLEKQFMTIQGLTSITSANTLGNTNIVLQFDVNKSIEAAAQDVQTAITAAKSQLPPTLPQDPTFKKVNPSDTPIVYIALTSDLIPLWDLYEYANTYVGQRLSMLDGVAQVIVYGSPYAVRVQIDPGLIASKSITMQDISDAVTNANPNLPTGLLDGDVRSTIVQTNGQLDKAYKYDPVIVSYINNAPVRVRDIGRSVDGLQNDKISLKYVDKEKIQSTVVLAIQRQPGANTIKVADEVAEFLPKVTKDLPASIDLIKVFDRSESIRESIHEVKLTLLLAFILVIVVIFIYLGKITDTIIPSVAMPISIIATFIVMYFCNYTIDNLSLLAFTLAIGFIIDDAIVVLENIVRHVEMGETPWEASLKGSKQISFTILSMTLSLAAVFIPLLFMGGLIGKIFQEFSVTLMVVTLASGVVSLTLTPMLCSIFIPPRNKEENEHTKHSFSERFNNWLLGYYKAGLTRVLRFPLISLIVAILSLVLTIHFFRILPLDFIPDDDIGFILAFTQAEQGTSSKRMTKYQDEIINVMRDDDNIDTLVSVAGYPDIRQALFFIRLKPYNERGNIQSVIGGLYGKLGAIPGVNTYLKNIPLIDISIGPISRGAYQYALQTLNFNKLYPSALRLIERMEKDATFVGVSSDMEVNTPQLYVDIKRDQSSSYGTNATEIENAMLYSFTGNYITRIETPLDQYDVILELLKKYQHRPSGVDRLYVRNNNVNLTQGSESNTTNPNQNNTNQPNLNTVNPIVPMQALVKWKEGIGPASVNHISQFPAVTLSFNINPSVPLGTALQRLEEIAKETLDPDVNGSLQGAAQTFQDSISTSAYLLLFSVFCIYIVLGILYESFIHPITILSTLPPAIVGGLLTLYLLNLPLSLYGYLGIILLIGIVKKNGIMMVDYALDNIRRRGESAEKSIFDAALVRFRPIMMTTVAAIVGAIPIAIGLGASSQSRRPLGYVIIGGLIVSQMITLFVTPVIYLYLENLRERFGYKEQHISHEE